MKYGTKIYDPVTGMTIEHEPIEDPYELTKRLNEKLQRLAKELGIVIETTEEPS